MAIRSRAQRELERRRKAKKNRSQLLGATQQGQRAPMQQGYTTTKVEPPPFRKSTVADDITQAGLAYKGGKGLFDFTQGKEAYTDKAGKFHKAVEPWTIGGENIGDTLSGYGTGLGNLGKNLWNMKPGYGGSWTAPQMGPAMSYPRPIGGVTPGFDALSSTPSAFQGANTSMANVGTLPNSPTATQLSTPTVPQGIDKLGLAGAGFGTGMSIYDMVDQGITPGNAMGLIGSLGVGASAFPSLGLAALGPIGMGIGAIGGLGSLFDWW